MRELVTVRCSSQFTQLYTSTPSLTESESHVLLRFRQKLSLFQSVEHFIWEINIRIRARVRNADLLIHSNPIILQCSLIPTAFEGEMI